MWDLQSGKLLRSITDAHPTGSAVLHVVVRNRNGGCCVWLGMQLNKMKSVFYASVLLLIIL